MLTALGRFLRVARIQRGMLLKDMADLMGLKPSYISSIENGKRKPSEKFLHAIKAAMVFSENELAELEDSFHKTVQEVSLRMDSDKPFQIDLGLALARSFERLTEDDAKDIKNILNRGE